MASPPFNINQLVPADNDIVSQFPATERTFRDIVESWFLVDGNTMGRKNKVSFDHQNTDPAGTDDVTTVWADSAGILRAKIGTGNAMALDVPLGTILEYSLTTLPEGYIWADGTAVTSAYPAYRAALIAAGNPYGSDGVNPLRPDRRERVAAGKGNMGGTSSPGRLDSATTLGGTQGAKSITLLASQIPPLTGTTSTDGAHTHNFFAVLSITGPVVLGGGQASPHSPTTGTTTSNGAHSHTVTIPNASQTATPVVQPTIIMNYIIRAY